MNSVSNPRNAKLTLITCACGCGEQKQVRTADVKRGWGKYINKSHKARHQTKTHPYHNGKSQPKGGYKGGIENASPEKRAKVLIKALQREEISPEFFYYKYPSTQYHLLDQSMMELIKEMEHQEIMDEGEGQGWDAHKDY